MKPIYRHSLPVVIERGADLTLSLPLADAEGSPVAASAASLVIRSGAAVLETVAAADINGDGAVSYDLSASTSAAWPLTEDLLLSWAVTVAGVVHTFRVPGAVVLWAFTPTITADDVWTRYPALQPAMTAEHVGALILSTAGELERRLRERGRRPQLILDVWALADVHLDLALWRIFDAADNALSDDRWRRAAELHRDSFTSRWGSLSFRYDEAQTGAPADAEVKSGPGSIVLTSGRAGAFWSPR